MLADKVQSRQNTQKTTSSWSLESFYTTNPGALGARVIDLEEITSNIAQKVMAGKPIAIDGQKVYSKLSKELQLQQILHISEKIMFKHGNAHVILRKKPSGRIAARMADPQFPNKVIRIGKVPYQAVIWSVIKVDRVKFFVKEVYDYNKIVRHIFTDIKQTTEVPLAEFNSKFPPELAIPAEEVHNCGFLPVIEGFRKPVWDYSNPASVKGLYKFNMQSVLDETTKVLRLENQNNRTRVLIDQQYVDKTDKAGLAKLAKSDFLFKLDGTGAEPGKGSAFEIMQGDPKFSAYWENINNIIRIGLQASGYSDLQDGESSNPTATGAIFTKAEDLETSNELVQFRQEFIKEILIKAKLMKKSQKGVEDDIYDDALAVIITPNIIFNELAMTNTLAIQKSNGWISDQFAISRLHGISISEADKIIADMPSMPEAPIPNEVEEEGE